jgi:hypothetical protein
MTKMKDEAAFRTDKIRGFLRQWRHPDPPAGHLGAGQRI